MNRREIEMGRTPEPERELRLRNSRRANDRRGAETHLASFDRTPPAWLADEGLESWNTLAPMMDDANILTAADVGALARYCVLLARWRAAESAIATGGATYTTGSGIVRARPEVASAATLAGHLARLEAELCLTPAARARARMTAPIPSSKSSNAATDKSRFFRN